MNCLDEIKKTNHSSLRQKQRHIDDEAIEIALKWGSIFHIGKGRIIRFIGNDEIEEARSIGENIKKYNGIMVVMSDDDNIITVLRNRDIRKTKIMMLKMKKNKRKKTFDNLVNNYFDYI